VRRQVPGGIEILPFGDQRVPPALAIDRTPAHYIDRDRLFHGGAAVTRALRQVPGGGVAAVLDLPLLSGLRDAVYRVVAASHAPRGHR
jgi:predicted DCC family thiol-disulfide oxidoreductase YuxK